MHRISHTLKSISHSCSMRLNNMAPTMLRERFQQSVTANSFRSYLAEFLSTFFYVFAVVGSSMSARKLNPNVASDPSSLVVVAVANALALSATVYSAWNISGGHVNPAVTFGMAVGGHISVPTALFYWVSQILAAVFASLVLKVAVVGQHVQPYIIAEEMTGFGASIMEGIMTFGLVYTVYAAGDTRRGTMGVIGPIAIGFIAGANVLASGPFSGGSMNPACAFGSAVTGGSFKNQAVYWVGPLIGAAVAGLLYDNVVFPSQAPDSIRGVTEGTGV